MQAINKTIILSDIQALIIRDVYISVNNSKKGVKQQQHATITTTATTTTTTTKQQQQPQRQNNNNQTKIVDILVKKVQFCMLWIFTFIQTASTNMKNIKF